ncbi:MAG: ABC transporter ATP-binding protein [Intestinibacter sp.]|nr:ABC transporter ATP-binding protein [Intestinibacter sp.]
MKTIISYIKPELKRMIWGLSIKFVGTIMDLCIPWILAYMIDNIIFKRDIKQIYLWGLLMVVCATIGVFANVYANRNAAAVGRDVTCNLRYDLYKKINTLSSSQIDYFTVPSLISRLTTDTNNIHRTICIMQRLGVRAPILLIGGIMITLTLDPVLTFILILIMPFIAFFISFISKRGVSLYMSLQKSIDSLVRVIRENITGVKVIKAFSKADYERERFYRVNKEVSEKDTTASMVMSLNQPIVNILFNLGLVLVVVVGAYRVEKGAIQVGVIVAFLSYFTIILTAMKSVTKLFIMYFKAEASAIRVSEILEVEKDLDIEDVDMGKTNLKNSCKSEYHIQFKNVAFSYNKKSDAIKNISFEIKTGDSLGIIGPIGSGKSTIILLLMGFYKIDEGEILINGVNIDDMNKAELRNMFGVVFQNDYLFSKSIYENIDLGRNLPDEEIKKAAISAQAMDFIDQSEYGFEKIISQKGNNLSGGQKQRVLLARAFAGNPEILLLDDASSALDFKTDMRLRESILENYKATTKIIIDSRINSIKKCSKIMVLDGGQIVGYGDHEELLKSCPMYFEINEIQNGDL